MTPGFGRLPAPDARDARYPMQLLLRPAALPSFRYYQTGPHLPLDQGQTGTCVLHAWGAFLYAALIMDKVIESPFDMYRATVGLDEFSGNDHEMMAPNEELQYGTSVRAGAQYLRSKGHLKNFVWAHSADEMALWILTGKGTIVNGTRWDWGMSDLKEGYAIPDGNVAGGHAYLVIGYNTKSRAFRCLNSWGPTFGENGRFWIHHDDMNALILDDGEACAAVEQKVVPLPQL